MVINVFKYLQNAVEHIIQYTKENYNDMKEEKKANSRD